MECSKWQEEGLLYISKELSPEGASDFERHLGQCLECRGEADQYKFDSETFFKESVLGESTSADIDKKIIAACCRPAQATTGFGLFSGVWIKKAAIATIFLVFGMSAGVYFTMNYFKGSSASALASTVKKSSTTDVADKHGVNTVAVATINDSSSSRKKDSIKTGEPSRIINRPIGSRQQGIITVDLKKE